jgi:hypothetical protein
MKDVEPTETQEMEIEDTNSSSCKVQVSGDQKEPFLSIEIKNSTPQPPLPVRPAMKDVEPTETQEMEICDLDYNQPISQHLNYMDPILALEYQDRKKI